MAWGFYLLLTSLYCLLAFLPYTYFALIKAPAYAWMPQFAHHQSFVYWLALAGVAAINWERKHRIRIVTLLAACGVYLTFHPFLPSLQNKWPAYMWSLIALVPLCMIALWEILGIAGQITGDSGADSDFDYAPAVVAAIIAAVVYGTASDVLQHSQRRPFSLDGARFELVGWSILSHVLLAVIIVSILN